MEGWISYAFLTISRNFEDAQLEIKIVHAEKGTEQVRHLLQLQRISEGKNKFPEYSSIHVTTMFYDFTFHT